MLLKYLKILQKKTYTSNNQLMFIYITDFKLFHGADLVKSLIGLYIKHIILSTIISSTSIIT